MKPLRLLSYFTFFLFALQTIHAEPFSHILTSAKHNIQSDEWQIDDRDISIDTQEKWSVRKTRLHGGKQEGVEIVEVDNGSLRLTVIPTRGMSIFEVIKDDLRLGWNSPVKEIVHPQFMNLQSRGGLGWLEGFNEWMVRCGLESAGHPGQDKFVNNVGDEATMDLTLHGKIGNIPASEVQVIVETEPPFRIRVRGRVDERMFYGPQLELWTEIATEIGSNTFTIKDSLTNKGGSEQEFQLIYHGNFGPGLLESGSQLVVPIKRVSPFNAHAAKSIAGHRSYGPPTYGFIEQVYCIRPWADSNGNTLALLHNKAANRGVSLRYSLEALPYLTQWKNSADLRSGYVTGIEPGTGFPYNRRIERHYGRVPTLKPSQTREFELHFKLLDSAAAVSEEKRKIQKIAAGRPTKVQEQPEADLTLFN